MWRERLFWPIVIGALVIGAFGIFASLRWYFSDQEIVRSFGETLFISGFLSITVDRYVKWKMLHEVSRDVSKFLIGWQLPKEMQDRIGQLMKTDLVRRNLDIHYRMVRTEEIGRVVLRVRFSFDLVNLTDHKVDYQQYVAFEKHDNPQIQKLECDSSDERARYKLDGTGISQTKPDEPGVVEAYGPLIKIKPNRTDHGTTYRVAGAYSIVFPEEFSDIFSFATPTINVTVTADWPDDIDFIAPPADVTTTNRWEYNRIFLTSEHIHVRWFKKQRATQRVADL